MDKNMKKKGIVRIILLFAASLYFISICITYLTVSKSTGLTDMIMQEGYVVFWMAPIIAILFLAAAIYELAQRLRGHTPKGGRIVFTVLLIISVGFYLFWSATHSQIGSRRVPVAIENYDGEIAVPLLDTICPDEYALIQTEKEKRAEHGVPMSERHLVYQKSDAAEIITTQEHLKGDADEKTGIIEIAFYYTTTFYTRVTMEKYVDGLVQDWGKQHTDTGSKLQNGAVDGCNYQYLSGSTQYLILWDENSVITTEYSGSADLRDSLQAYAQAVLSD